jgi:uncharacterized membrane protein YccF (DUF307 family)
MGIYKETFTKLSKSVKGFNNFTILLIATLCSVLCFGFAAIDVVEPTEDIKAKISGIFIGLVSFLIVFGWWKKFTFLSRVVSCLLVIFTAFSIFCNIDRLISH